jgi:ribosomal protein S27AE
MPFASFGRRQRLPRGKAEMPINDPPPPTDRPICAACGWTMWIARIEAPDAGKHKHVYKCGRCDNEESHFVKL